jgi:hypothetical protein
LKLQPNGKPTFGIVEPPTRIPKTGGNLLLIVKPRPFPPLKKDIGVGSVDTMGKINIGRHVEGNDMTDGIPQMKYLMSSA